MLGHEPREVTTTATADGMLSGEVEVDGSHVRPASEGYSMRRPGPIDKATFFEQAHYQI